MKRLRPLCQVYLPILIVALTLRIIFFFTYFRSSLPYYSMVQGLDMQVLMYLGELFLRGEVGFNFYCGLTSLAIRLGGLNQAPDWIVAVQMAGGILSALLVAYCALHIWGKRSIALLSGLFMAVYAPALLYEAVTLKESNGLFFSLLGLAAVLWMHRRRFSLSSVLVGGMVCAWPGWVRFSGMIWFVVALAWLSVVLWRKQQWRRRTGKTLSVFCCGAAIWSIAVAGINLHNGVDIWPFMIQPYSLKLAWIVSSKKDMNSLNPVAGVGMTKKGEITGLSPKQPTATRFIGLQRRLERAGNYFLMLFRQLEICNNINYYFMRGRFFPLGWLPGPMLLISLGVAGLLLWLWRKTFLRKEAVIWGYLLTYSLPLAFWVPLGRYRLVLVPIFCLTSSWLLVQGYQWLRRGGGRNWGKMAGVTALWGAIWWWGLPSGYPLRDSDFVLDGKAWELKQGRNSVAALTCYRNGCHFFPESASLAINYGDALMRRGRYAEAEQVLSQAGKAHPENPGIVLLYASSLLATGQAGKAERILQTMPVPDRMETRLGFYFTLGESFRLNGKKEAARQAYLQARQAAATELQKRQLDDAIRQLTQ